MYTDGSCLGNPGPGGWAVYFEDEDIKLSGGESLTTNNIMELTAVIMGLEKALELKMTPPIKIYTDSMYVKNGITKWIHNWVKNDWKKSDGKPVKNQRLWSDLWALTQQFDGDDKIEWNWVKAHNGTKNNELVDKLARQFAQHACKSKKIQTF
jgi:ribonuclease HI